MSFIRVIDKWTVQGHTEPMQPTMIPLTIVVMGKSGMHRGAGQITITPITPSGDRMPAISISVEFEGDNDRGFAATGTIGFPVKEPGPYWFEVAIDRMLFTKTAIRVTYMRTLLPPSPQQQPPQQ